MDLLCPDGAYYVFDIDALLSRLDFLKKQLPGADICYAVKANTFIAPYLLDKVERFEICSPGEMQICASVNIIGEKTVISGIYKEKDVIENAVISDGSQIFTVESLSQFDMLVGLSEKYKKRLKLLLRLTNGSQFGINKSEISEIVGKRGNFEYIDILGIQFFSGTQKTSAKKYAREIEKLRELLDFLFEEYGFKARELEYGTGLPVEYFIDEDNREEELMASLSESLKNIDAHVILEIGRSLAAHCGAYYTHVVDLKCNKGVNYAVCDGGMHHIVYFGQSLSMRTPNVTVVGKEGESEESYALCGSLCSMNDILVKSISLPKLEIGDTLSFPRAGAYCVTEGIALFLSRDLPRVFIKVGNEIKCVRERVETARFNGIK